VETNRKFLATISLDDFPDWVVVVAFYTGVHLVERLRAAANDGHSKDHDDRLTYVQQVHPAIHTAYHQLQNASMLARYQSRGDFFNQFQPEQVRELIVGKYLVAIEFDEDLLGASFAAKSQFVKYNMMVAEEKPPSWSDAKSFKSKLLFEEFSFGASNSKKSNELSIYMPDESRLDRTHAIVSIGSLRSNNIKLDDASVSRRHCVIVNLPDEVWLYDLGSTIGTTVDGERVLSRKLLDGVHQVDTGLVRIRIASSSDKLL